MSIASLVAGAASFLKRGLVQQTVYNVMESNQSGVPGAKGDHQATVDGVMAAGSAVLTSAAGLFAATDVGKSIWVAPTDRTTAPRVVNDGTMTAGNNSLTSASGTFVAADAGKWVSIAGAGIAGAAFVAKIVTVSNATTVLLSANAITSVAGRSTSDAVATAGAWFLTSASAAFTAADVGRTITVAGAAAGPNLYTGTIMAVTSPTVVQVDPVLYTTVTAAALTITGANTTIFSLATGSNVAQRSVTDCATTGTGYQITSATAGFTASDVGRFLTIAGAGFASSLYAGQIVGVTNATTAQLQAPVNLSVSGATMILQGKRQVNDAAIDSSTPASAVTLTSSAAVFNNQDTGGYVSVAGAGISGVALVAQIIAYVNASTVTLSTPASTTVAGAAATMHTPGPLATTIASYQSPTQVTLSDSASIDCAGAQVGWGTDDTLAIQAAFNAVTAGGEVRFPPAVYICTWQGTFSAYGGSHYCVAALKSNIHISGYGATMLVAGGNQRAISVLAVGDSINPLTGVTIAGLTFDGNGKALRNPCGSMGDNSYCIPSQLGCAPGFQADEFVGGVNIRGPFTPFNQFPKIGQLFTQGIQVRDCNFYRWSNGAFEALSYADTVRVNNCLFDGGGVWANRVHLDGCRTSSFSHNRVVNLVGTAIASAAVEYFMNGDAGIRPAYANSLTHNYIAGTQAGMVGVSVIGTYCDVVDNIIERTASYGLSLSVYNASGEHIGSTHNRIAGNRLVDCKLGLNMDGLRGTVKSGTCSLGSGGITVISWTGTAFSSADIGSWISVAGAGIGGSTLVAAIVSFLSATSVTISASNQSGALVTGAATSVGGAAVLVSAHNIVTGNDFYNNAQATKAGLTLNTGVTPAVYGRGQWTSCSIAIDNGQGNALPAGGNLYTNNRVTGAGSNIIRDNTFGVGVPLGAGALGAVTYNAYYDNYLDSEDLSAANIATRISIASALIPFDNWLKTGRVIGHQGGNASNVFGTPIRTHRSVTAAWNPGAITNGTAVSTTVTVTGAAVGDNVRASYDQTLADGMILSAQVTGAGTVTVSIFNATAGSLTPTSGNVRVDWWAN